MKRLRKEYGFRVSGRRANAASAPEVPNSEANRKSIPK